MKKKFAKLFLTLFLTMSVVVAGIMPTATLADAKNIFTSVDYVVTIDSDDFNKVSSSNITISVKMDGEDEYTEAYKGGSVKVKEK